MAANKEKLAHNIKNWLQIDKEIQVVTNMKEFVALQNRIYDL